MNRAESIRHREAQDWTPLDPAFRPAALFHRRYLANVRDSGDAVPLVLGLERERGFLSRYETVVRPHADAETIRYVLDVTKFLVWARGGWKLHVGGPEVIGAEVRRHFSKTGARAFDVNLMGRVYEREFEVILTNALEVPAANEAAVARGGHVDGCRIGFDLGASDFKVAAVQDGNVLYSDELPWQPGVQINPDYHYDQLNRGLKAAAVHLPRVDAIGGSSAGVIVNNRIMVASLIRSVAPDRLDDARNIFVRLRGEWRVPLEVANDGDVTALAGGMSLQTGGLLGLAMGSSEAAGYIDPRGAMTGWLSELAFAPVDCNPDAALEEWSGDRGVGALYFSQQAVNRLLPAAGIDVRAELSMADRLKEVQRLMDAGDKRAEQIYETIGGYLGFTIPHYADFYEFEHVLVLGRVTTGPGGDVVLAKAREVLNQEFPALAEKIRLHVPDEKSRRVGQAVAAASLPARSGTIDNRR